ACQFVLWFNLAKARGKSGIVGLMVLLPVTNLFAFPYLAFSDGVPEKSDLRGSNIMTLELA
ncbi:MAG TPA: hypothetical protein VLT36_08380, partial [Candidatus Dormibacteraeota bacterium]|nr:hypothetical protein [Candidatus Dormibacteraeota bacterium]